MQRHSKRFCIKQVAQIIDEKFKHNAILTYLEGNTIP